MAWVLAVGAGWVVLGAVLAVVIGRGIRLADRKQQESAVAAANVVVDPDPVDATPVDTPVAAEAEVPAAQARTDGPPDAAPGDDGASDRFRHPIPSARPAPFRPRTPNAERTSSTKRSGS